MNTLKKLLKNLRTDSAFEIEPGKRYVIELDHGPSMTDLKHAREQWQARTGSDVVFLYGGRIVRSEEVVERVTHPSQDRA